MANLQSLTLQERMNTINGDGLYEYTFQEACNKWISDDSLGISVNLTRYTPDEAFAIIRDKADLRSKDLVELINEMGPYEAHEYTATEALNKKEDVIGV